VIVVDDHSEDETVNSVRRFADKNPAFKILRNDATGKKTALTLGIHSQRDPLLLLLMPIVEFPQTGFRHSSKRLRIKTLKWQLVV
jgi:glycosyltransferase involved in cell wall biosynthesis